MILCLNGCSSQKKAQRHLSKALDHIAKAKKFDPSISLKRIDTLKVLVPIKETKVDTTFVPTPGDTVIIHKDKLTIKYLRMPGDTVWLEGVVAPDTVIVKVPCESETLIKRESYKDIVKRVLHIGNLGFVLIHVFLGLGLLTFLYLKFKPI